MRRVQALAGEVLEGPDLTRLDRASHAKLDTDRYRYRYAPLLLLTLERHIGRARMRELLKALVTLSPDERARRLWLSPQGRRAARVSMRRSGTTGKPNA